MGIRMTRKQARDLGICHTAAQESWNSRNGSKPKKLRKEELTENQRAFLAGCKAHGIPEPDLEYVFDNDRGWRIDFLIEGNIAVEAEGSPWCGSPCPVCKRRPGSRHTHGQGYLDDMSKYNALTIAGYWLIRVTWDQVKSGEAFATIKRMLESGEHL